MAALGGAAAWAVGSQAQARTWRVGVVGTGDARLNAAFERGMAELGYVHGKNFEISFRNVGPQLFQDAITSLSPNIDVLVVWGTLGGVAAKRAAVQVPTVFLSVGAPVDIGLVESLARPGGNMTGVAFEAASETYGKRLEILKEILPTLSRVGLLRAAADANVRFAMDALHTAGPRLGIAFVPADIASLEELNGAFASFEQERVEALLVIAGVLTYTGNKRIAELAIHHRLPSCHGFKETVASGGLVSLGPDLAAMARQGAAYVHKLIGGANAADLPVEQPSCYELHINLKTAKILGVAIPPSLLARADEVIE